METTTEKVNKMEVDRRGKKIFHRTKLKTDKTCLAHFTKGQDNTLTTNTSGIGILKKHYDKKEQKNMTGGGYVYKWGAEELLGGKNRAAKKAVDWRLKKMVFSFPGKQYLCMPTINQ